METKSIKPSDNNEPAGVLIKILTSNTVFGFKPQREFYNSIGINQKRFGMLCRDQVSPTLQELKAVCDYFSADIKEFI